MVDVFGEVDEQLRADRLRAFLQKAVPLFIVAMVLSVLAVLGVWSVEKYRTDVGAKASLAYNQAFETETKGDAAKAFDQFGALAGHGGTYGALALMQQGGIRLDQNKPAEAAALFDKAAAATKNPMLSDLAALKSIYALMDTAPYAQLSEKLTPLTYPERPYHAQAREALAMAKLAAGKVAEAKGDFIALSLGSDVSDSVRQRAQAVLALIDTGTAKSLKSLEEQAKTAIPIQLAPPASPAAPQDPAAASQPEAQQ